MRTFTLTDGTTRVDLINITEPGIMAVRGGLGPTNFNPELSFNMPPAGDGAFLTEYRFKPVIENWRLNIKGDSQDNASQMLQTFQQLLRKAALFHLTRWQSEPVWLENQATDETNKRYALIYGALSWQMPDLFKVPFEADSEIAEMSMSITREPFWRSLPPRTLPTHGLALSGSGMPSPQANSRQQVISNYRGTTVLTHIFQFDTSAAAFSANQVASNAFPLFEVSGSTPAAGDIMYLGSTTGPWFNAVLNLVTGGVISALTLVAEYWNGSAWTTFTWGNTNRFINGYTGLLPIKFGGKTDWAATTINGANAYWIRLRISAVTSWTTSPAQGGQLVYVPTDNYVELDENQIKGDVHALTMVRVNNHNDAADLVGMIMLGFKSKGLDYFISHINAGGQNPTDWSLVDGTDTASAADPSSPAGARRSCTFATNTSLVERLRFSYSSVNEKAFEGQYRAFLRCQQIGGSIGDVSVRLTVQQSVAVSGDTIKLIQKDDGMTLVDLGIFDVMPNGRYAPESDFALDLRFSIEASALSSTPDLYIYDLILIPVDEWTVTVAQTGLSGQYLQASRGVQIDAGVQRMNSIQIAQLGADADDYAALSSWETRGALPTLPPRRKGRLYGILISQATGKFEAPNELSAGIEIFTHDRWLTLRGAD